MHYLSIESSEYMVEKHTKEFLDTLWLGEWVAYVVETGGGRVAVGQLVIVIVDVLVRCKQAHTAHDYGTRDSMVYCCGGEEEEYCHVLCDSFEFVLLL